MILTEKEAMTKWCHRAIPEYTDRCIASRCMAWRWFGFVGEDGTFWEPKPNVTNSYAVKERRGYCGLAGTP